MTEKRFTDVWCSETGQIGLTDNGVDKTFTGDEFEEWLNDFVDRNKQLKEQNSCLLDDVQENNRLNKEIIEDIQNELTREIDKLKTLCDAVREELSLADRNNTLLEEENEQLKQELFETSKELLWATSDEVDRALHYEEEVEELRKEIFG